MERASDATLHSCRRNSGPGPLSRLLGDRTEDAARAPGRDRHREGYRRSDLFDRRGLLMERWAAYYGKNELKGHSWGSHSIPRAHVTLSSDDVSWSELR